MNSSISIKPGDSFGREVTPVQFAHMLSELERLYPDIASAFLAVATLMRQGNYDHYELRTILAQRLTTLDPEWANSLSLPPEKEWCAHQKISADIDELISEIEKEKAQALFEKSMNDLIDDLSFFKDIGYVTKSYESKFFRVRNQLNSFLDCG